MTERAKSFEEIEHTSDWAYRVRGENLAHMRNFMSDRLKARLQKYQKL
jgi:hypothetical protein